MKLFPVLMKELLDNAQSRGESLTPPVIPTEANSFPPEPKELLVEIPDVTDPPAGGAILPEQSAHRPAGRLFSQSLSARILLGGGLLLFLIAAMPVLFRSHSPSEDVGSKHPGEGRQPPAPTASEVPQWTTPAQTAQAPSGTASTGPSQKTPSPTISSTNPPEKASRPSEQASRQTAQTLNQTPGSNSSARSSAGEPTSAGNSAGTRDGPSYYPTSINYPYSQNRQLVYYPGTDGRWYPVPFPPGKPPQQNLASENTASPDRNGWENPNPRTPTPTSASSGYPYPRTGYGPSTPYRETSRKEIVEPESTYPSENDPRWQVRARGESMPGAYPSGYSPAARQWNQPGDFSAQSQIPYGSTAPTRSMDRQSPWREGVPRTEMGGPEPYDSGNLGQWAEEPGVARFKGTIEKPTVRSAYEGTGSSLY